MDVLERLGSLVTGVFGSVANDPVLLGIMVVVVVLAGLIMRGYGLGRLITATLGALIVYAGASIAREIIAGGNWQAVANARFNAFLDMDMGDFLVYFLAFAIVITGVYLLKSLFQRG